MSNTFSKLYQILSEKYTLDVWWESETPTEIIVGAILMHNASWNNVRKALDALKRERLLDFQTLHALPSAILTEYIRPAGLAQVKTRRLQNLLNFIDEKYGSVEAMANEETDTLRAALLGVNGVGEETADSILLYALRKPAFVVDAYTRRILSRHGLIDKSARYGDIKSKFESALPADTELFDHFHGLMVELCKEYCLKNNPRCAECPLRTWEIPPAGLPPK